MIGLPKQPRSPQPRSSQKITTMLGFCGALLVGSFASATDSKEQTARSVRGVVGDRMGEVGEVKGGGWFCWQYSVHFLDAVLVADEGVPGLREAGSRGEMRAAENPIFHGLSY